MKSRAGIALFAALVFTAIVALLLAGAVASTTMSQRSSTLSEIGPRLDAAADGALATLLTNPAHFALADLPLGVTSTFSLSSAAPDISVTASATRLPGSVLWLTSDAEWSAGGRRRFNVVARFPLAGNLVPAGIVSRGNVRVDSGVTLVADTSTDVECGRRNALDAVVAPGARATGITTSGDSIRFAAQGAALDSSLYRVTARQLAALDSAGAIVHIRGDTTIFGGQLDGILVADGSITIAGPYRVTGLISARGKIIVMSGLDLNGALMSFAPAGSQPAIELAESTVSYSPCGVDRALRRAFPPRQAPKRGWAEIF